MDTKGKEPKQDTLSPTEFSEGLCSEIRVATLCTTDLEAIKFFYVKAMGMTLDGPIVISEEQQKSQRKLWQIPEEIGYKYYHLHRAAVPGLIELRVLVLDRETPMIHQSYSSRELGPFSLGFPNGDQINLDKRLTDLGVEMMAKMQEGEIPRADGSTYRYWETIYKAPDFLHVVGIMRGDGMKQLAPINPENKMGGPGYSAQVLTDSDHGLAFFTEVLDMELRADRYWETAEGSALGIEAGVEFRFALVYAKGTSKNHMLFLDYQDGKYIDPGVSPRVPNQGLGMWSFQTNDVEEVLRRAEKFGSQIIQQPVDYESPIFGPARVMTLLAPNGFLIEVFEK